MTSSLDDSELTLRRRRFIAEYLVDGIATQAAIRAGYSEDTAASQASRLLRNVKVQAKLRELEDEHLRALDLTAERVALAHWQDHLRAVEDGRTSESTAALNGVLKARSLGGSTLSVQGEFKGGLSEETVRAFREARERRDADT